MRVFVGTLYSGENEFEECIDSIKRQSYKDYEHFVFKHLPKKKANEVLFRSFMNRSDEFDILIKVDADMVLERDDVFDAIVEQFRANPSMDVFIVAVRDFFSDRSILGLPAYRERVKWPESDEPLYTEIPPVSEDTIKVDFTEIAPAAFHCKNPSSLQAFHYGVHRALKVIQPNQTEKREADAKVHFESLDATWQHLLRTEDKRLALCVLGAEMAYANRFRIEHLDYGNPHMNSQVKKFEKRNTAELIRAIRSWRFLNFGFLPTRKRRIALQQIRGGKIFSRRAVRSLISTFKS